MGKWIWVDFATPNVIQVIKGFSTFFMHGGCFCHFLTFRIHFNVLGVFRSFFIFRGCISPFLGVKCVLDIFCLSRGILVIYQTYRGILFLFK